MSSTLPTGPLAAFPELTDRFWSAVAVVGPVAAAAADEVDRAARFPEETLAVFREQRLLSALIPESLGGMGIGVPELAGAVRTIASHCAASALMLAMHSIDVANLVRLGAGDELRALQREIAADQLLCANANSEVGSGADLSASVATVTPDDDGCLRLRKDALAISFGERADLIFTCARRAPDAEPTDQVQVICRRPRLEPLSEWDSLGLRGTCSRGYRIVAELQAPHIYPIPFAEVANSGGMQTTLLLLSSVWVGIADAAAAKAHAYVRAVARRRIGQVPPSALRLSELSVRLAQVRALHDSTRRGFAAAAAAGTLESPDLIAELRNLKVAASEGAVAVASAALEICGIAGYRRDTPFSLDRHLRDAYGGVVMVSNDRVLHAGAETLLVRKRL
ncbi:acyl-CoA dehydrogenase family protein [Conexibacter sp. DBS9H8]|uniref:acyl-CoA dehydrogenase family protein n=1 Tax=Conexibacter sp. DBS9H8 TaxID=2937801 RepID=UPI00200E386C|nr:acyl-CoA dehydrogenase family protein [Conexibacter sp. DBS9H8]